MDADALRAAFDEQVADLLRTIEDKLYETGTLASAVGHAEADVTIAFQQVPVNGKTLVAMVVQVATAEPFDPARSHWEPLRQCVVSRFASLLSALPPQTRECLLDCHGPLVFVNGTMLD